MPDIFVPTEGLKFSRKVVNGRYEVLVPSFMDVHQWWHDWETERFRSMEENLKPGMVLIDVGAFDGWQSVILSRFVGGGKNMVLVEPVTENWANIKATWQANGVDAPRATYVGFIGPEIRNMPTVNNRLWPTPPDYSNLIAVTKFQHLNENADTRPSFPLDILSVTAKPDALNIDVEGAELIVLESAAKTLRERKPLIWLSIHPEFMRERYGHQPEQVAEFLRSLGYKGEYLGEDHEQHFMWRHD